MRTDSNSPIRSRSFLAWSGIVIICLTLLVGATQRRKRYLFLSYVGTSSSRVWAIQKLGEQKDSKLSDFTAGLDDVDKEIRYWSICEIEQRTNEIGERYPIIVRCLADEYGPVRGVAVRILSRARTRKGVTGPLIEKCYFSTRDPIKRREILHLINHLYNRKEWKLFISRMRPEKDKTLARIISRINRERSEN